MSSQFTSVSEIKAFGKVLLINPPVYDYRFPWAQWRLPIHLLKLAHFLAETSEIKVFDYLENANVLLPRKLLDREEIDGQPTNRWRYGVGATAFGKALQDLSESQWRPDAVVVNSFTTFWWQGVAEAVNLARERLTDVPIFVTGVYGYLCSAHAKEFAGADGVLGPERSVALAPCSHEEFANSLGYSSIPMDRSVDPDEVVSRIEMAMRRGIKKFVLENSISADNCGAFMNFLEVISKSAIRPKLFCLGEVDPSMLMEHEDMAILMRAAGYKQIVLSDDREYKEGDCFINATCKAVDKLVKAGYRPRTEDVSASMSLGRPHENLEERAETLTRLAHVAGSVVVWPYQPYFIPNMPLHLQNGKLFPLRRENGYKFSDYSELLSIAAVLNSKYRDCTFDFMGTSLTSRLLANSLHRRGWEADPAVKGTLALPVKQ